MLMKEMVSTGPHQMIKDMETSNNSSLNCRSTIHYIIQGHNIDMNLEFMWVGMVFLIEVHVDPWISVSIVIKSFFYFK